MSKNQAFAGKMKALDGTSVSWSMIGSDSTEVPIAGINALGTAYGVKWSSQALINRQDNNAATDAFRIKANTTPVPQQVVPVGSTAVPQTFPPQQ